MSIRRNELTSLDRVCVSFTDWNSKALNGKKAYIFLTIKLTRKKYNTKTQNTNVQKLHAQWKKAITKNEWITEKKSLYKFKHSNPNMGQEITKREKETRTAERWNTTMLMGTWLKSV